jgi:Zn-dependent peptidase ImmA (M78 family)
MATSSIKMRPQIEGLFHRYGISKPAIPVEKIAKKEGATVTYQPFEGNLAGMLVNTPGNVVIGVNSTHPLTRQRFTIAHELGHLFLHANSIDGVHLDRDFRVHRRDSNSSLAVDKLEIEANRFAAELLMPHSMIMQDIEGMFDVEDPHEVRVLAARYEVSPLAMAIRISNLLKLHKNWD